MEWKQDYRIGILEIDEQHKALVGGISCIEQEVARYERQSADAAIVRLSDLAQAHFTLEPCLMRIHDYPGLAEHANHHEQFLIHLGALQERFLTTDVFNDRIGFLHEWWDTHVPKHDKSYALHFLQCAALGKT